MKKKIRIVEEFGFRYRIETTIGAFGISVISTKIAKLRHKNTIENPKVIEP